MPNTSDSASNSESEQPTNTQDQRNQQIVLIVDDEQQVLDIARRMTERLGYQVLTESNPHAAFARYTNEYAQIVCVLLDLAMRPINGLQLFAMMQVINPHVRAILCSGYGESDSVEDAIGLGVVGFLPKPYRIDELRQVLVQVLAENTG